MLKIHNPADGSLLREVASDAPDHIQEKSKRARNALNDWASVSLEKKIKAVRSFADSLAKESDALAATLTSETGKPITQSRNELNAMKGRLSFFIENTKKALSPETVFEDKTAGLEERITRDPLGVVANISAWNYPYFVGSNVFIPALLTGNTVLYKPSECATLTGLEIGRLLKSSGIPEDVFIPILGEGPAGEALLQSDIDAVFFTGSHATGRTVAAAAGARMIKTQLELGGKDPAYVAEDADPATAAASLADGAFYNNGQSCCAIERIYLHKKIAAAFTDSFVAIVKQFKIGDPTQEDTYIGPLTRAQQIPILEAQIHDAKEKGARLLCGGKRISRDGHYFEPTVFDRADHSMALMREESFGPIIGLQSVNSDQEALEKINDTSYGLTAGVYSPLRERAEKILSRANAGSVYWNCCDRVSPHLPWSGRRDSGLGLTLSQEGISTFLKPKAWHMKS